MKTGGMLKQTQIILLFLSCYSCASGVRLLGIDREGEKVLKVTKSKYSKRMGETLVDIHDSAIVPANSILTSTTRAWDIKWFNIGLGIEGKVGIAGIATLAATPRIRLYFRKKR